MKELHREGAGTLRERGRRPSLPRRVPLQELVVGILAVAVLVAPFATGSASAAGMPFCSVPGQFTPHPIDWYSIKVPSFPSGTGLMTDYAVEPLVPERLYVSNGEVVMRSQDSGCHWTVAYTAPTNHQILEIEVSAPGTLYLPLQEEGATPRPHVVVSHDAGSTWTTKDGPLLGTLVGSIRDFDASLGNPNAAAVLIDVEHSEPGVVTIENDQTVLTTSTGGDVWELADPLSANNVGGSVGGVVTVNSDQPRLDSIKVNPVRPNEVWLYGEAGAYLLTGGNRQAAGIGSVAQLDVTLDGAVVFAYRQGSPVGHVSFDGGQTFETFPSGFVVSSVAGSRAPLAVLSTGGKVFYQIAVPGQPPLVFPLSPLDGRYISDVQVALKNGTQIPFIYGRTETTIEVKNDFIPDDPADPGEVTAHLHAHELMTGENGLRPESVRVTMRPGQSSTLPFRLQLPAASTPLDVYFMIDISGSMGGTINGVRSAMQDIVDRLSDKKIDVQFGVGAFRAYGDPPAYDRLRDIGPAGDELADALNSLNASGGGAETQMAALLQSVTGKGDHVIPPNLNMNFRPGSLRVAIEATDELISQGGAHPSYETVIDALLDHDVKMVGLAIQDPPLLGEPDYENPDGPAGGLSKVAEGSKALAPPGGVDCDGDADAEISEGKPIVCQIAPSRADDAGLMADAIVNVLAAIRDVQDLTVTAVTGDSTVQAPSEIVESINPSVFPGVDLKEPSAHRFDLTVRCPHVGRDTTYPIDLSVTQRGAALGQSALTVVCKPVVKRESPPIIAPFVPLAAIAAPAPRPPDPVPEPNPNPQPNPQQNPQAQAGFAAQEQQQPQVAVAHNEVIAPDAAEQPATDEFMMSAHNESRVPPLAFVFATAGLTAAYAYSVLTRTRTRTAHARNRRARRG
jgi:von Willebrand factor type A domain